MTVLVDTGMLVAYRNPRDGLHKRATTLVDEIQDGKHGNAFTSDYVFDEAVGLAMARTRRAEVVRSVGDLVLPAEPNQRWIRLLYLTPEEFHRAWDSVKRHTNAGLSFTDWTIVEMVRSRRIDTVASFDAGLSAWVARIG